MESMEAQYGSAAEEAGVYIVNACGFDCIPNDLGALLLQQKFPGQLVHADSFMFTDNVSAIICCLLCLFVCLFVCLFILFLFCFVCFFFVSFVVLSVCCGFVSVLFVLCVSLACVVCFVCMGGGHCGSEA